MARYKEKSTFGFFSILGLFLLLYFGFYALWGPRGYLNYQKILSEVTLLEDKKNRLAHKREKLESRVHALSSQSLDLDMLEERVRIMLNYSDPDDLIVYID